MFSNFTLLDEATTAVTPRPSQDGGEMGTVQNEF